jgi:hypothetical protein
VFCGDQAGSTNAIVDVTGYYVSERAGQLLSVRRAGGK